MRRFAWLALAITVGLLQPIGARADAVEDLVAAEMGNQGTVGVACLVIQEGRPPRGIYRGMANLEWNEPVTAETVFEIGSVTKQFTAAGILLLAQDGKLDIDDKIARHLSNTPASWSGITLRHLMTHTSGITNYDSLDGFELRLRLTQDKFIKRLATQPLVFQPGESWSYCNSGFNLLSYVIENASGTNYWAFLDQRIFQPLGMIHTTRRDPRLIIPRRAAGYEKSKNGLVHRNSDLTDLLGAGAIVSTVEDLAKWNAALNGDTLLNAESKRVAWTPVKLNNGETRDYGFGWHLKPLDGHVNIGHSGSTSGFSASFQRFPDDKLTVVVLSNTDDLGFATRLAKKIAPLYFAKPASNP
jgi:CubicO group peptidase (beta-lactamase class C family)